MNGKAVLVLLGILLLFVIIKSCGSDTDVSAQVTPAPTAETIVTPEPTIASTEQVIEEPTEAPTEPVVEVTPTPIVNQMLPVVYRNEVMQVKKVAITIDDLTKPDNLDEILDLCETYGFKVTLFALGKNVSINKAQLRRAYNLGCEIGNHTYSHEFVYSTDDETLISEMLNTENAINEALGFAYHVKLWRCPGGNGSFDPRLHNMLSQRGYESIILWNISSTDMKELKRKVEPGSIMLYHTKDSDVKLLKKLIPWLYTEGYTSVTVSELMGYSKETVSELPGVYTDVTSLNYTYDDVTFKLKVRMYGVRLFQQRLVDLGYLDASGVDGDYGDGTAAAVKQLQADAGLTQSGEATPEFREFVYSDSAPHAALGFEAVMPTSTPTPH